MSEHTTSFEGEYEHKLDKKLRVSVPASWRPKEGSSYTLRLLKWEYSGFPIIKALTENAFQAAIDSIQNDPELPSGIKNKRKGTLYTHNQPVNVNTQGKMLIPKKFAEARGLVAEASVHLLGRGNNFDLIDAKNYEALIAIEQEVMADLYETLDFG